MVFMHICFLRQLYNQCTHLVGSCMVAMYSHWSVDCHRRNGWPILC
jgi:hypothetical protein